MSLLQQESELDHAARGEDYTKGSSHLIWASLIAAVVITAGIAVYVIAGQKPVAATGEIEQVWAYIHHAESSGLDASGATVAKDSFDQVLVFALVKLHNQSNQPLFLHNVMTNATLDDGIHSSYTASAGDYDRVFIAYPNLTIPHGKALSLDTTIAPGQTVEGTVVSSFRMTRQQWDARKDLSFTFGIRYQPNLVLAPHTPITDQ
jgi:hypothetical protein